MQYVLILFLPLPTIILHPPLFPYLAYFSSNLGWLSIPKHGTYPPA